jgi:CheY-like chemotaxis protein
MLTVQPSALRGLRILVVEDTALVADELVRMLKRAGCCITGPCATLGAAMEAAQIKPPPYDGALLDINLRGEWVYPAADVLIRQHIPFVFLTGYGADAIDPMYLDHPMLEKPFGQDELVELIARTFPRPGG